MHFFAILSSCLSVAAAASLGKRAPTPGQVSQVTNYGGPTAAQFWIYVPKSLKASPGVMAAVHYCTGSGQGYANNAPYKNLAEKYGFIAIFPGSPHSGGCWDVSSKGTLTHEGGGDSNSIANMVKWAIKEYNVDTNKVFVQGESSGAMMTNVLAATYPDLFKAGVVYSGVNAGCFMSSSNGVAAWNGTCANGQSIATPQAWGQVAKNMYPGYNGTRPKMLIYHGGADSTLRPQNYQETMKQWSGVFGYNYDQPESTKQNDPQSGYVRTTYGPLLQGVYAQSVGHSVPLRGEDDMKWFGFA